MSTAGIVEKGRAGEDESGAALGASGGEMQSVEEFAHRASGCVIVGATGGQTGAQSSPNGADEVPVVANSAGEQGQPEEGGGTPGGREEGTVQRGGRSRERGRRKDWSRGISG